MEGSGYLPYSSLGKSARKKLERSLKEMSGDPMMIELRKALIGLLMARHIKQISGVPDSLRIRRARDNLRKFLSSENGDKNLVRKALSELEEAVTSREEEQLVMKLMDYADKLLNTQLRMREIGLVMTRKEIAEKLGKAVEVLEEELGEGAGDVVEKLKEVLSE